MQSILSDLRLSARRLASRPIGTLVAIVSLSLGIGIVSTMYVLFRAATNDLPPVPAPDRLARVFVANHANGEARIPPAPAERRAWLDSPPRGVSLALVEDLEVTIEPGNQLVRAQRVSSRYFDVAGVRPEIGRVFAGSGGEVILSRRVWDLLPDAERSLGRTILVDGEPCAIVAVMPAGFWMPVRGIGVWLPAREGDAAPVASVLARLDQTTTAEQTSSVLNPVVQHLRGRNHTTHVRLLASDAAVRRTVGVLMLVGPAVLVLAGVCANIAALLLSDVHRRRQEIAVRTALGASRWRLAREAYSDAIVLAALASILSVAGAYWSLRALRSAFSTVSPEFAAMLPPLAAVMPIAILTAAVAVLGIGYVPALFSSRVRGAPDLNRANAAPLFRRGRYGWADLLVVLQIAMAAALVLWTGIFANIFERVRAIAPHVPADRVWTIEVTSQLRHSALPARLPELLLSEAAATSGIEAAGLLETERRVSTRQTWLAWRNGAKTTCVASVARVRGDYFRVHGFPLRGQDPGATDVVLNESAARRCGNPDAIQAQSAGAPVLRVVGSVDDHWAAAGLPEISSRGPATIYHGAGGAPGSAVVLSVRSKFPDTAPARQLRDQLATAYPGARFGPPISLATQAEQQFSSGVLIAKLLSVLALFALYFGIVGVHAAVAQALALRTREIGVRIALGAGSREVIGEAVGHHVAPAVIGILLGACVAVGALLTLGTDDAPMIRQVAVILAQSPATWAWLAGLLLACALLSAAAPVARALRVDPCVVLRHD